MNRQLPRNSYGDGRADGGCLKLVTVIIFLTLVVMAIYLATQFYLIATEP